MIISVFTEALTHLYAIDLSGKSAGPDVNVVNISVTVSALVTPMLIAYWYQYHCNHDFLYINVGFLNISVDSVRIC